MNVKELRIGNYIESPRGLEEIKYAESLEEIEGSPHKFNPIRITPYRLEMLGFQCNDEDLYSIESGCFLMEIEIGGGSKDKPIYKCYGPGNLLLTLSLEYVHQLQNLYYFITYKELKWNSLSYSLI